MVEAGIAAAVVACCLLEGMRGGLRVIAALLAEVAADLGEFAADSTLDAGSTAGN